jgi:hypothetical protein
MQGLWYRLLVDINIYEAEKAGNNDPALIKSMITDQWKIEL